MTSSDHSARTTIVAAFNRLVFANRKARPPIAQLLREAGVARSTLYRHFDDREALLLEAMGGPLSTIANASIYDHGPQSLTALLEHFWDHRKSGDGVFSGPFASRLVRSLADKIQERAPTLQRNDALRIAEMQISFVRLWASGETPGSAAALAEKMIASAKALRAVFEAKP